MKNRVRLLGHAMHPYLVPFPIGLLATSVIFDVIFFATHLLMFSAVAFWMITAGCVFAVMAAVPGFIDWLSLPSGTRAKTIGATHSIVNVAALAFFVLTWALRWASNVPRTSAAEFVLSLIGFGLLTVGGWLGGELVERLGVGVHEDANLDAPSSLGEHEPLRPTEPRPV